MCVCVVVVGGGGDRGVHFTELRTMIYTRTFKLNFCAFPHPHPQKGESLLKNISGLRIAFSDGNLY